MKRIFVLFTLLIALATSAVATAAPGKGYGALGPRGNFDWRDYASLTKSAWSGVISLKIADKHESMLKGFRIIDHSGKLLLDLTKHFPTGSILRVEQGLGLDVALLRKTKLAAQARCQCDLDDIASYYSITLDTRSIKLMSLMSKLNQLPTVELAYPRPNVVPPPVDIPPTTPDYSGSQQYKSPAPIGVDVAYAAGFPGGDGAGVRVVDIEVDWDADHEDLETCVGGLIPNSGTLVDLGRVFTDHGTAVLGIILAGDNGYGGTGMAPAASCHYAPGYTAEWGTDYGRAIMASINSGLLTPGDVLLLEAQVSGPRYDPNTASQFGLLPVDWIPSEYSVVRMATASGYVIVEAAGNGEQDLDDALYGNRFDRTQNDSGAIMVGGGTPPSNPPARVPAWFTNFGDRLDVQAWGNDVTTTGYGGLFDGGGDPRQYYTGSFAGTSSASAIITGTVALATGVLRQRGVNLTPIEIRTLLVDTGTPQNPSSRNIGPMPDLRGVLAGGTFCGNNTVDGNEVCDDGNAVGGDGCSADCMSDESCGNSLVDAAVGEACDDGNAAGGDGCAADCLSDETCGNSFVDTAIGETCDDGNTIGGDGCTADCSSDESCGNSIVDDTFGEACDDGNQVDGDGCSATCAIEDGGGGCCAVAGSGSDQHAPFSLLLLAVTLVGWRVRRRLRPTNR